MVHVSLKAVGPLVNMQMDVTFIDNETPASFKQDNITLSTIGSINSAISVQGASKINLDGEPEVSTDVWLIVGVVGSIVLFLLIIVILCVYQAFK